MLMIFRVFLLGHVVSCLLDSFDRVCVCFSQCYPGPPADRANVLRGLSSPSPRRLEQRTTPGVD